MLSCLMFSCGKVHHRLAPEAQQAAVARVLELQHKFMPLHASQTLQGFAALGIKAPEVFAALLQQVRREYTCVSYIGAEAFHTDKKLPVLAP